MPSDIMPELNAVVGVRDELTPRQIILRVLADGWELPHFEPGQYTLLGLPPTARRCTLSTPEPEPPEADRMIVRAYSMASSSLTGEYMDFYVSLVSNGALTPRLFALNVGDRLWLSDRVVGMFTLREVKPDRHIVLVATGTGLAPYMSMLTTHLDCGGPRKIAVLHGAFHSWDLGYRDELLTLQHLCSNFSYIPTIDKPEEEPAPWHGKTGWVQNLWRDGAVRDAFGFEPTPENTDVFICGNPNMIKEMESVLTAEGFQEHSHGREGQIHIERY
jgi:ferredoxin/flavodoxin---NADP+ reductase